MPSYTKDKDGAAAAEREQYLERPLPNSADSERAILGAVIIDNGKISQAIEQLRPDDFYVPAHRRIFNAMVALFERGSVINELLIAEELKKEGTIESVGGITAISNLTYGLPHFAELDPFSKIVRDRALQRNLIKVCNKVIGEVLEGEEEADAMLDHAEQAIFALADERTRQGFAHIRPIAEKLLEQVEAMTDRRVMLTGLTTGFSDFDQMTSGLQPSDLIIVAARPSMGKCESGDTEIILSDGSVETIEEIYNKRNAKLLTLGNDLKFKFTEPSNYVDDGIKPVYCVKTQLGRKIECTLSHPLLTFDGWRPLYDLQVGQKIAVPRVMNVFGNEEMRECEVKLLGYLIGDGSITKGSPVFTVANSTLREDFERAVYEFGGVETVLIRIIRKTDQLRVRKAKILKGKTNPITGWLRELGLFGCNSHTKFVPPQIFKLKRHLVAMFLNRLFSTDGWACVLASGQAQLGYASVSEKLARQVQHLLLRFGIIASLKERQVKYKDERRASWQLDITDARSIKTFIKEIGIHGKEDAIKACANAIESKNYQTNKDLIPIEVWSHIARLKGKESWASLARRAGLKNYTNIHVGKRAPTRDRLFAMSLALNSAALNYVATSEVYWDEIVSIEYAGEKQVYDLTIPETHNFIANDICVHNTSLCLTLAQNAAIQASAVVAVFSLEMSKEALVMRMLCSEGRVDAHRFRSGFLARDEWPRLANALATLSEAKIFIDDTAGISVLEMRAKARRLATEQKKLDLIIVDYLQLMSGSRRTESRQQEVSQISRELKALAKELNVPVIALSQLSRAPETRTDHKPQLSDLRESGCLAGDTLVRLADSGKRVRIRELAGQSGFAVWALNEETQKIEKANVSRAFSTGVKPVFRLTTKLGRNIRATANHKFYTFDGWKRLDRIKIGERIAVPQKINSPIIQNISGAKLNRNLQHQYKRYVWSTGFSLIGCRLKPVLQTLSCPNLSSSGLDHLSSDGCSLPTHVIWHAIREKDLSEKVTISPNEPMTLANSDIDWDEIVSIEPDGIDEVFDLTVDEHHNFVANDMLPHNSIEQDADVVAFIYREEQYNRTEENAGLAEIIIAKQRNGPTGTIKLAFLKEFTRFENMWRE